MLDFLNERIQQHKCRNIVCAGHVPGLYHERSLVLFIGLSPSQYGNRREPFTGRDRELFDRMLTAIGETRETVSVTNIVKCVMPSGSIHQHAATYYADWKNILVDELVALQPEVVVLLGREVGVLFDIDGPWTVVKVKHPAWYLYENRSPDLTEWNCVKKAINASKYNTRLSSFTGNREGAGEGENDEHH